MGFVGDADFHFAFVSHDLGIDALLRDQAELNSVLLSKLLRLAVRARLVPLSAVRHAQLSEPGKMLYSTLNPRSILLLMDQELELVLMSLFGVDVEAFSFTIVCISP